MRALLIIQSEQTMFVTYSRPQTALRQIHYILFAGWLKNEKNTSKIQLKSSRDSVRLKSLIQYFSIINICYFLKQNLFVSPFGFGRRALAPTELQQEGSHAAEPRVVPLALKKRGFSPLAPPRVALRSPPTLRVGPLNSKFNNFSVKSSLQRKDLFKNLKIDKKSYMLSSEFCSRPCDYIIRAIINSINSVVDYLQVLLTH